MELSLVEKLRELETPDGRLILSKDFVVALYSWIIIQERTITMQRDFINELTAALTCKTDQP